MSTAAATASQSNSSRSALPLVQEIVRPDGSQGLRYNFHPGQLRAWNSTKRIPFILAGTQSGKTSFGPLWLHREIARCGPGDYMVVTPTFPLLNLKALTEFLSLFKRRLNLGDYSGQARTFTYHDGSVRVLFGHANDPDSLEAATAKAAWLDEAGQRKFRLGSWEAIQRRLAVHQGRVLITTTPYDLGWLKQRLWDPWVAAGHEHPEIDVIGFDSTTNPAFPREEFERARRELPTWKFDLFYRARFTRPAGLIYDSFIEALHKIPRFAIPGHWPRLLGLDFGGVNTAGLFFAAELRPNHEWTGRLFLYREYKAGGRTAAGHTAELLKGEPCIPYCVGGSASEGQWRDEFRAAGLPVQEPPIKDVEVGIDRVYGAHRRGEILVMDDLTGYLEEKLTYSREVDEVGNPTEKIEDKHAFHFMDAERYAMAWAKAPETRIDQQPEVLTT
jgi:hypothetical protein